MMDYVIYSASVSFTVEEDYRIWYNKNKHRKLNLLKPTPYVPLQAPEFWGQGQNYDAWLAAKNKSIREKKE